MTLPPKPVFHPNDSFRSMQGKLDAFYADLERLVQLSKRLVSTNGVDWAPEQLPRLAAPQSLQEGFLINIRPVEFSDEDLLTHLERENPTLAERLRKRLNEL